VASFRLFSRSAGGDNPFNNLKQSHAFYRMMFANILSVAGITLRATSQYVLHFDALNTLSKQAGRDNRPCL
jgi:hypothetical protein